MAMAMVMVILSRSFSYGWSLLVDSHLSTPLAIQSLISHSHSLTTIVFHTTMPFIVIHAIHCHPCHSLSSMPFIDHGLSLTPLTMSFIQLCLSLTTMITIWDTSILLRVMVGQRPKSAKCASSTRLIMSHGRTVIDPSPSVTW